MPIDSYAIEQVLILIVGADCIAKSKDIQLAFAFDTNVDASDKSLLHLNTHKHFLILKIHF